MNERVILYNDFFSGTLSGNVTRYLEFPWPATFVGAKAWATNDSSATLALAGASKLSIAAQAIGDSGDPAYIEPTAAEKASTVIEPANSRITLTLDYDGAGGTAAENVGVMLFFLGGDD